MLILLLTVAFCVFPASGRRLEKVVGVVQLTTDEFKIAVADFKFVVVGFYNPQWKSCAYFKEEFRKATADYRSRRGSAIFVNIDQNMDAPAMFGRELTRFPMVLLHRKLSKRWIEYDGRHQWEAINDWLSWKALPHIARLDSERAIGQFNSSAEAVIITFIATKENWPHPEENDQTMRLLRKVERRLGSFLFGRIHVPHLFEKFNITNTVQLCLFRSTDGQRVDYDGEMKLAKIVKFIQTESYPLINRLNPDLFDRISRHPIKMCLIAFLDVAQKESKLMHELQAIAKSFRRKIRVIIVDDGMADFQTMMDIFDVSSRELPTYRMFNLSIDYLKFKPPSNSYSQPHLHSFVKQVLANEVKPIMRSQKIPSKSNDSLQELVGQNYNPVVMDKSKAVFVLLYSPDCPQCAIYIALMNDLADILADRKDMVIGKMDVTANDALGLRADPIPRFLFYPKGSQSPILYMDDKTLEAMLQFVKSNGKDGGFPRYTGGDEGD